MEDNLKIRNLVEEDFDRGYIELLSQLTETGSIDKNKFKLQFSKVGNNKDYIIKVVVDEKTDKIVATGSVLIEHKFIHGCSAVGHIEDIVVHKEYRGKHLGKHIIQDLIKSSKESGCYKTILCCKDDLVPFYEKCGLNCKEKTMAVYH